MSPKSKGRPQGRGKQKKRGGAPGSLSVADKIINNAGDLVEESLRLVAEEVASAWLGTYWVARDPAPQPEDELIRDIAARALIRRTPEALAAVYALRLIAPPRAREDLDEAIKALAASGIPVPAFVSTPAGAATGAWTGEDPWGSRQVLFVEYGGPTPHVMLADIAHLGGSSDVEELALLDAGLAARWDQIMAEDEFPVVLSSIPVEDALAQLARLLKLTDGAPDRAEATDYFAVRSLAHARCVGVEPAEWEPTVASEEEVAALVEEFRSAGGPVDDVAEAMVGLLVEYGQENLRNGLLSWTPDDVGVFLLEWLPDTVEMDAAAQAVALDVTKAWVRFALGKRGLEQRWIDLALEIPDEVADEFAKVCAEPNE